MDLKEPLRQADYEEPRCPLCAPKTVEPIPVRRVMEKLDEYLGRNDLAAAERHLNYWLAEAEAGGDLRGKLTVVNEQTKAVCGDLEKHAYSVNDGITDGDLRNLHILAAV